MKSIKDESTHFKAFCVFFFIFNYILLIAASLLFFNNPFKSEEKDSISINLSNTRVIYTKETCRMSDITTYNKGFDYFLPMSCAEILRAVHRGTVSTLRNTSARANSRSSNNESLKVTSAEVRSRSSNNESLKITSAEVRNRSSSNETIAGEMTIGIIAAFLTPGIILFTFHQIRKKTKPTIHTLRGEEMY